MNNRISASQLRAIIITSALGMEILILPIVVKSLQELIIILASGLIFCIVPLLSDIKINDSRTLCIIYSVKNILVSALMAKIISDVTGNVLHNNISDIRTLMFIALTAGYCAYKGFEPMARTAQMFFWFIVIGTLYVYFMSVPDIRLSNISLSYDLRTMASSLLMGLVINTGEIIALTKYYTEGSRRTTLVSVILSLVLSLFICLVVMGRLGARGMESTKYPLFEIMYAADLPGMFIKRQEAIFISLWLLSSLLSLFVYVTTAADYMSVLHIKRNTAVLCLIVFIFLLSCFYRSRTTPVTTYCMLQVAGGIFTVFIIPLIYIFGRKKR